MTSSDDLGQSICSPPTALNVPSCLAPVEELARDLSASWFASTLADLLHVDCEEAYLVLRTIPDPLLVLLESPQGWTDLGNLVARKLGLGACPCAPTIQ